MYIRCTFHEVYETTTRSASEYLDGTAAVGKKERGREERETQRDDEREVSINRPVMGHD